MRALLDVNVLLALLDADHADHAPARRWLTSNIHHGWASCPLTENGFVRVISQSGYPSPISVGEAMNRLGRATRTEHHELWPCDGSILDESYVRRRHVQGHRQITDVYLLALAVRHGGRLVTFDGTIPLPAVPGAAPENLLVL